jgi:hypothetical protein
MGKIQSPADVTEPVLRRALCAAFMIAGLFCLAYTIDPTRAAQLYIFAGIIAALGFIRATVCAVNTYHSAMSAKRPPDTP